MRSLMLMAVGLAACHPVIVSPPTPTGAIDLPSGAAYDSISLYLINTSELRFEPRMRDSIERSLVGCLERNGFRVFAHRVTGDIDGPRWFPRTDIPDSAAALIATAQRSQATLVVQMRGYAPRSNREGVRSRQNPVAGGMSARLVIGPGLETTQLSARLVDGSDKRVVWKRDESGAPETRDLACHMVYSLRARHRADQSSPLPPSGS